MDHTYFADSSNVSRNSRCKSNKMCIVPQCYNRTCGDRNISLHRFPKDFESLVKWVRAFKLEIGKLPKNAIACSDHFCGDDFISLDRSKRRLKPNAIPSRKLPTYSAKTLRIQAEKENKQEWNRRKQLFYEKILARSLEESMSIPKLIVMPIEKPAPPFNEVEPPITRKIDASVQVETVIPRLLTQDRPKMMTLIQTDAHMQICTNLSIKQFHTICEMVKNFVDQIPIVRYRELDISSKILLTLMKLKENHSFTHLSFLFDVTAACCSSTFYEMVGTLRQVLCQFITWPSKEEIRRYLPKEFSDWPQTRVVIDCVEIEVSSSSCLKCKNSFCSHLKIKPTIKFLVGMAPSGPITFLTDVYDGETPAKTILNECGLLSLCEPGDKIIANRGFVMDEPSPVAAEKPVSEPGICDQSQFSHEEVENIKPVVSNIRPVVVSTRPATKNTRPVTTNTKATPKNARPVATNIKSEPKNTKSVLKSVRLAALSTKLAPKNTKPGLTNSSLAATNSKLLPEKKPVTRNIIPAAANSKPLPDNTGPIAANTRPILTSTRPVAHAKVPIHIKTVERIKTYEILNSPITSEMFNGIDLITNVICALVNFTSTSVPN